MNDLLQTSQQYSRPGDLLIGGITSQFFSISDPVTFKEHPKRNLFHESFAVPKNYQHVLSLVFALEEINENLQILPNLTLGFSIYDSYFDARMAFRNTLNLLFNQNRTIPNYNCGIWKNLIAVIGGLDSEISLHMATLLGIYKIAQLAIKESCAELYDQSLNTLLKSTSNSDKLQEQSLRDTEQNCKQEDPPLTYGKMPCNKKNTPKKETKPLMELCFIEPKRQMPKGTTKPLKQKSSQKEKKMENTQPSITSSYTLQPLKQLYAVHKGKRHRDKILLKRRYQTKKPTKLYVTYCLFAPAMSEVIQLSPLYRVVPSEEHQYTGIVQLLLHFHWNWIAIIAINDDKGERFVQTLAHKFSQNGICIAFMERIPIYKNTFEIYEMLELFQNVTVLLTKTTVNVCIVNADSQNMSALQLALNMFDPDTMTPIGKVWVMTAHFDFSSQLHHRDLGIQVFHGALSFAVHLIEIQGFPEFLRSLNPHTEEDGFIRTFWQQAFDCVFPDTDVENEAVNSCTGEEKLESLPGPFFEMSMTGQSYSIYNAVYAVAHALHAMILSRTKYRTMTDGNKLQPPKPQTFQLHHFLRKLSFNNSAGEKFCFDENGELAGGFDVINWVTFPNKSFLRVKIGRMDPQALPGRQLSMNDPIITWHNTFNQVPRAVCNDNCPPGYSRKRKEGEQFCCYDCAPCPEGKISDQEDMDDCTKCPEDKYPNPNQNECLQKHLHFLSYGEPLGRSLAVCALSLSLTTAVVLGIFVKHRNTPIVKANNRELSYVLLVSLLLCFLCSLLFIGRPHFLTCLLRQTAFGVIFTVAISSLLTKTIIVVLAFMASKPGSKMKKGIGKSFAFSAVSTCSFIQMCLCLVCLCYDPPFPNVDMNSLAEEIIVECNEGSANILYYVLGYIGFLSLTSFFAAYFARKLPDSFNEAKFITFSMLVFCIVWVSFVPTYLGIKGKYMTAVEIFSILASGLGLLGCIFSPKCYIIVLRPELNSKECLIRRNE
ncbi:PREDICTED: vomeronasal type-2 receptor 26-like [Gekko japonicus]|uniref:Vomeronasal type-2 receptor 26-like n=1 Tax=Gekko japonicus TaxID=146911 RepID=A0ABM1JZG1_GEKJA|nr:PREDICTED: vomeronasal type-2 receptor 26-like [Gekko japonicus]